MTSGKQTIPCVISLRATYETTGFVITSARYSAINVAIRCPLLLKMLEKKTLNMFLGIMIIKHDKTKYRNSYPIRRLVIMKLARSVFAYNFNPRCSPTFAMRPLKWLYFKKTRSSKLLSTQNSAVHLSERKARVANLRLHSGNN